MPDPLTALERTVAEGLQLQADMLAALPRDADGLSAARRQWALAPAFDVLLQLMPVLKALGSRQGALQVGLLPHTRCLDDQNSTCCGAPGRKPMLGRAVSTPTGCANEATGVQRDPGLPLHTLQLHPCKSSGLRHWMTICRASCTALCKCASSVSCPMHPAPPFGCATSMASGEAVTISPRAWQAVRP